MSETETRKYRITATKEQLDILETLFRTMEQMGSVGSSRAIKLFVDGDGAFHPKFERVITNPFTLTESSVELKSLTKNNSGDRIEHGYGTIKKNCDEWNGDGYYIYYDFG